MNQFQQPINSFRKSGAIPTTNYSSQATTPHNNKITVQALSQQQSQVAALQPSKQSNSAGISNKQHKDKDANQNLNINIAAASQKGGHTNSQVTTANSQRLQAAQKLQWQSQNQDRNHPQSSALQTQLNSKPFQPKTVAADKSHNKPCNSAKKNEPQITKANEDLFESNRETEQAQASLVVNVMTSTNQQQQKFMKINSFSNSEQHDNNLQKQDNNFTNNQEVGEQKNSVLGQVNFSVTVNSHHNHLRAKSKGISTQQVQTPNVANPLISDSRFLKNNLISKSQPDTDALKMPDSREQQTDFSFSQQDKNGLQSPQDFTPNLIKEGQKTLGQKNSKIESAVGLINFQKQEKESNPPPPSPQTGKHFELLQKTEKFCILKFLKKLEEIKQIKEIISESEIMDVDLDLKNQRTIKVDAIRTRISEIKALIDCYPSPFQKDEIPELIEKILTAYCK